jgi:hypothetical protein
MTTTLLLRPIHADRNWTDHAACRPGTDVPADMFSSDTEPAKAAALHVCRNHCPVIDECKTEAELQPYRSMVAGGVAYNQHGEPDLRRTAQTRCPLCTFRPAPWPEPGAQARGRRPDPRTLKPCGTQAAYNRHRRRGEPIDDACRQAHSAAGAPRKREQRHRCKAGECPHPEHRAAAGVGS